MQFDLTTFLLGTLFGTLVVAPLILGLILSDDFAEKVVHIENFPFFVGAWAIACLLIFGGIFFPNLRVVFPQLEAWVWWTLGVGLVLAIIVAVIFFNRHRSASTPHRNFNTRESVHYEHEIGS